MFPFDPTSAGPLHISEHTKSSTRRTPCSIHPTWCKHQLFSTKSSTCGTCSICSICSMCSMCRTCSTCSICSSVCRMYNMCSTCSLCGTCSLWNTYVMYKTWCAWRNIYIYIYIYIIFIYLYIYIYIYTHMWVFAWRPQPPKRWRSSHNYLEFTYNASQTHICQKWEQAQEWKFQNHSKQTTLPKHIFVRSKRESNSKSSQTTLNRQPFQNTYLLEVGASAIIKVSQPQWTNNPAQKHICWK
jgi:hypothetical protein